MSSVFGLYIGNSTASIAVYKEDEKTEIIANDAGDRTTLATVYISTKEEVVGLNTSGDITKAISTITRCKTFLDESLTSADRDKYNKECNVKAELQDDFVTFSVPVSKDGGVVSLSYSPSSVASLIFKKLYSIGSSFCSDNSKLSCVLTVPLQWSHNVRNNWEQAAISAGWKVLQVINEPSAALLPYLSSMMDSSQIIAIVYRLGGYSCEATVFKVRSGFLTIVGKEKGDTGVRSVIELVAQHLAEDFRRKTKLEPTESRKSMEKLRSSAERLLKTLSSLTSASAHIESLCEGVDYSASLSRARLDALLSPALPSFSEPINAALKNASLERQHVDQVVFTGGGLNIAKIRSYISSLFPSETNICDSVSPQEVTAIGAAMQAGLLTGAGLEESAEIKSNNIQLKVVATPINVKVNGCEMNLEGPVPCNKSLEVPTPQANLIEALISQGETTTALNVPCPDMEKSTTRINVHIDREPLDQINLATLNMSAVEAS